jgi:hypothetical protein
VPLHTAARVGVTSFIPDLGVSVDWQFLSVALSLGSVSLEMNFLF